MRQGGSSSKSRRRRCVRTSKWSWTRARCGPSSPSRSSPSERRHLYHYHTCKDGCCLGGTTNFAASAEQDVWAYLVLRQWLHWTDCICGELLACNILETVVWGVPAILLLQQAGTRALFSCALSFAAALVYLRFLNSWLHFVCWDLRTIIIICVCPIVHTVNQSKRRMGG